VTLDAVRDAIDACGETDTALFARRTRNAIAMAIVAREPVPPARRSAPVEQLAQKVGDELGDVLAEVYEGGPEWTSRAIDALEPLHRLARR
jgi:hypothetical protein